MTTAYAGIDVAYAKKKALPVVICTRVGSRLVPLELAKTKIHPPSGQGNAVIAREPETVKKFADDTAKYLRDIEREFKVRIERIAIDAPSAPRVDGLTARACEDGLASAGIHFIHTPCASEFEHMREQAIIHLNGGGTEPRIKGANQLWMLVGFALFDRLSKDWECLEVYPQAIMRAIGSASVHKSKMEGLRMQLETASKRTGWPEPPTVEALDMIGFGEPHDRLDAYLAAWVASLSEDERERYGVEGDSIWIPKTAVKA